MGLVSKYGKSLVGRIFVYHEDDWWVIGNITKAGGGCSWVTYRPLARSGWLTEDPGHFWPESTIDSESELVDSNSQLSKYLELFSGTNR